MVLFRVAIHLPPARRQAVVHSLMRILGPTRALTGCLGCQLCADLENDDTVIFVETWSDQQHLEARLGDDSLRVLLSALDCATDPPEVRFDTISETRGMEQIIAYHDGRAPITAPVERAGLSAMGKD